MIFLENIFFSIAATTTDMHIKVLDGPAFESGIMTKKTEIPIDAGHHLQIMNTNNL